jgi:hypothetical protein
MLLTVSLAALFSYLLMLAAYFLPRRRFFHIPVMLAIMVFDVALPVFLYLHRHWWHRLIEQQEIFSSLVWMHLILLIAMYALDAAQIHTARKMLKGDPAARADHHTQAKALLVVRGLLILSGAILANPE